MTTTIQLPQVNQTASISDFSRGKASATFELAHKAPVFVLNHNKPTAVIIGIDEYNALREHLEDLEDERLAMDRLDGWDGTTTVREEDMLQEAGLTQDDIDAAPEAELA